MLVSSTILSMSFKRRMELKKSSVFPTLPWLLESSGPAFLSSFLTFLPSFLFSLPFPSRLPSLLFLLFFSFLSYKIITFFFNSSSIIILFLFFLLLKVWSFIVSGFSSAIFFFNLVKNTV